MTTILTALVLLVLLVFAFAVTILRGVLTSLAVGEIKGTLKTHLERRVHLAVAELPADAADDQAAEWLAELDALSERPLLALRFTRGLQDAACTIAADFPPQGADQNLAEDPAPDEIAAASRPQIASDVQPLDEISASNPIPSARRPTLRRFNVNFSEGAYRDLNTLAERKGKTMTEVLRDAMALERWFEQERGRGEMSPNPAEGLLPRPASQSGQAFGRLRSKADQ